MHSTSLWWQHGVIYHIYVHQVGPDQEGFFRFYQQEILPKFR